MPFSLHHDLICSNASKVLINRYLVMVKTFKQFRKKIGSDNINLIKLGIALKTLKKN
jgi:hypothetical protein